jgi:hypothetical protein
MNIIAGLEILEYSKNGGGIQGFQPEHHPLTKQIARKRSGRNLTCHEPY